MATGRSGCHGAAGAALADGKSRFDMLTSHRNKRESYVESGIDRASRWRRYERVCCGSTPGVHWNWRSRIPSDGGRAIGWSALPRREDLSQR